ncbi:uncharacterized protein N7518_006973 [Penicillium psychrosexuale]|uniref:uncharacterized protein n=1 Tax=Penicillium psychrosexuale TaxID=1002107 RepID=UPI0025455A4B|nr:uncharacterized protein N7518_006973 [Penicillium psychrosexuale]KAJ5789962.1 hypothetical protein N7518_006973 [Penicillium psychrosexuale]
MTGCNCTVGPITRYQKDPHLYNLKKGHVKEKKIGSFSLIERVILSAGAMLIFSVYFHLTICPEGRKDILIVQYNLHSGHNYTAYGFGVGQTFEEGTFVCQQSEEGVRIRSRKHDKSGTALQTS